MFGLDSFYLAAKHRVHSQGPESCISPEEKKELLRALDTIEPVSNLDLQHSLSRLNHFKIELIGNSFNSVVASEIHGLRVSIMNEASDRMFAFIPTTGMMFFRARSPFWRCSE